MVGEKWIEQIADGITAAITIEADSDHQILYDLAVELDYGDSIDIATQGDANLIEIDRAPSESTLNLSISVPDSSFIERVVLSTKETHVAVFLPSSELLRSPELIQTEDVEALSRIVTKFDSAVRLPVICGSFLDISEIVSLLKWAVTVPGFGTSDLHSYRYGVIRAAVTDKSGLHVQSKSELVDLTDGLDAINQIGELDLLDAMGDVMATIHDSPEDTDALLDRLGFDKRSFERRDDGFLLLCYLAFLVESRGLEAAEGYAMRRNWRTSGIYKRRVIEAQNVEFPDRGVAWRSLVCAAARHGRHEFAYILANACYWSARTRQTHSRVTELLYRGAIEAATEIDLDAVSLRAQFGIHFAMAHRLRSSHNFEPALTHFEKAEQLAEENSDLPVWRARYARGICESHARFDQGTPDEAIDCLNETIAALLHFEIGSERLSEAIHHLKAQKHEKLGDSTTHAETSVEHYETATDHYTLIDFDRSAKRCSQKTDQLQARSSKSAEQQTQSSYSTAASVSPTDDQRPSVDIWATPVSEPLPPEVWAAETGQYPARRDEEQIPDAEVAGLGSRNPGRIPDKESTDLDDPYIF